MWVRVRQNGSLNMDDRLKQQLAFALEIDKEKQVLRQTHLSGGGRRENDAEHAWHMAVMAYLLREYANEEVDAGRAMLMCLVHDLVEIYAGDTYAYDEEGQKSKQERESAARDALFGMLPEDQGRELAALFDEFEACETADARYVHAMDNLQPILLNDSNDGADWREHNIAAEQVYERQRTTKMGSDTLYEVVSGIIEKHRERGNLRTAME